MPLKLYSSKGIFGRLPGDIDDPNFLKAKEVPVFQSNLKSKIAEEEFCAGSLLLSYISLILILILSPTFKTPGGIAALVPPTSV